MKAYTDLEQSKKLAETLPLESADMEWINNDGLGEPFPFVGRTNDEERLPCWSLAALLGIFPYYEVNNNEVNIQLSVKGEALITEEGECLLDLVVNMIIHLHELKML